MDLESHMHYFGAVVSGTGILVQNIPFASPYLEQIFLFLSIVMLQRTSGYCDELFVGFDFELIFCTKAK